MSNERHNCRQPLRVVAAPRPYVTGMSCREFRGTLQAVYWEAVPATPFDRDLGLAEDYLRLEAVVEQQQVQEEERRRRRSARASSP